MKCIYCTKEIEKDSEFCKFCGSEVIDVNAKVNCIKCGHELPEDASFCNKCGTEARNEDYYKEQCGEDYESPFEFFEFDEVFGIDGVFGIDEVFGIDGVFGKASEKVISTTVDIGKLVTELVDDALDHMVKETRKDIIKELKEVGYKEFIECKTPAEFEIKLSNWLHLKRVAKENGIMDKITFEIEFNNLRIISKEVWNKEYLTEELKNSFMN